MIVEWHSNIFTQTKSPQTGGLEWRRREVGGRVGGGKQKDSLYFPLNEFSNRVASSPANSLRKTKSRLNAEKVLG